MLTRDYRLKYTRNILYGNVFSCNFLIQLKTSTPKSNIYPTSNIWILFLPPLSCWQKTRKYQACFNQSVAFSLDLHIGLRNHSTYSKISFFIEVTPEPDDWRSVASLHCLGLWLSLCCLAGGTGFNGCLVLFSIVVQLNLTETQWGIYLCLCMLLIPNLT